MDCDIYIYTSKYRCLRLSGYPASSYVSFFLRSNLHHITQQCRMEPLNTEMELATWCGQNNFIMLFENFMFALMWTLRYLIAYCLLRSWIKIIKLVFCLRSVFLDPRTTT